MRRTSLGLLMALSSLLATACSGQFWANTLMPRWGYVRHADIAYGDRPRQKLDVYVPDHKAPGSPVVVFFYGGSWQHGSRQGYEFVGQALASRGIIAVLPDYRLYPPTTFPTFVEDGAKATAWAWRHAGDYGGDPAHFFVSGHSAGAHIAGMLATDKHYLAAAGLSIDDLAGFIGMSGPYDFLPIEGPVLQKVFAPRSSWPQTQPIHFVNGDEPPMLLMHGKADRTVNPNNSRHFADEVNAAGGSARLRLYPDTTHIGLIATFAFALRWKGSELDDFANFVERRSSDSVR